MRGLIFFLFFLSAFAFAKNDLPKPCSTFESADKTFCGNSFILTVDKEDKYCNPSQDKNDCRYLIVTNGHVLSADNKKVCLQDGRCRPIKKDKEGNEEIYIDNLSDVVVAELDLSDESDWESNDKTQPFAFYDREGEKLRVFGKEHNEGFRNYSTDRVKGKGVQPHTILTVANKDNDGDILNPFIVVPDKLKEGGIPFNEGESDKKIKKMLISGTSIIPSHIIPGMSGSAMVQFHESIKGDEQTLEIYSVDGVVTSYNRRTQVSEVSDEEPIHNAIDKFMQGKRGIAKNFQGKEIYWEYNPIAKALYRVVGDGEIWETAFADGYEKGLAGGENGPGGGGESGPGGGENGPGGGENGPGGDNGPGGGENGPGGDNGPGGGENGPGGDPCLDEKKRADHPFWNTAVDYLKEQTLLPGLYVKGVHTPGFKVKNKKTGEEINVFANWEAVMMMSKFEADFEFTPIQDEKLDLLGMLKNKQGKDKGPICQKIRGEEICMQVNTADEKKGISIKVNIGDEESEITIPSKVDRDDFKTWQYTNIGDKKVLVDIRELFFINLSKIYETENSDSYNANQVFNEIKKQGVPRVGISLQKIDEPVGSYPELFSLK